MFTLITALFAMAAGKKASFAAKGMFPLPPQLLSGDDMVTDDPPGRIYWKVENGIRLTGMPGFKDMLTPTQMWQVSQLLQRPLTKPEQTKAALAKTATLPVAPPSPTPAAMQGKKPEKIHPSDRLRDKKAGRRCW